MTRYVGSDEEAYHTSRLKREAREALAGWIPTLTRWEHYVTLTYDPKRRPNSLRPPSAAASCRHVSGWLSRIYSVNSAFTVGCLGLEHHKNGWPHWHGLVSAASSPTLPAKSLYAEWFKYYGYARVEPIRPGTIDQVAAYVSKYLVKSDDELLLEWYPRGLPFRAIQDKLEDASSARLWFLGGGTKEDADGNGRHLPNVVRR